MIPGYVETENYKAFLEALKRLDERGAEESCIVIIDGKPGLGKSTMLSRWVVQTGSVYIRTTQGWDYSWMVKDILAELGVDPELIRTTRARFQRLLQELQIRQERAALAGQAFALVIDECDQVAGRREIIEGLRDISDLLYLPTVLVGMGTLRDSLRRYLQVGSRAPNRVTFEPLSVSDVKKLIKHKCEVRVADDLAEYVHRASRGYSREILDAIRAIETFGARLGDVGDGVTMSDMSEQPLMIDRASGSPVYVPRSV
ncbi:MAG: DNA transposition protein [Tistrella sp.]|uniref:AAA family ATPase n=1 Tax=Tistrella sp. TaxID=2024861 RepID=UPI000C65689B|nr:AAA family ATPase [Tistrella sp.]MAD39550.1 DNA transposition protein [Tistrella sp.]MBA74895.1 DNA transposition protein [Tistrella sp.]